MKNIKFLGFSKKKNFFGRMDENIVTKLILGLKNWDVKRVAKYALVFEDLIEAVGMKHGSTCSNFLFTPTYQEGKNDKKKIKNGHICIQ